MANKQSAQKRIRSNARKRAVNQKSRSRTRSAVRGAREALDAPLADTSRPAVMAAVSALDKAAEKGVVHKNNAARRKSRLMKQLNALEKTGK
ncbi:MAG: 30S ribosomal protein S20 [Anaerolineales bacterium]|nr:30S ribosomal protein S20 [Anaerolineales bacterium]